MADYSINAVTRRAVYSGSAGVGPYAFTFELLDENDIAVYVNTTLQTLTTDYTVTLSPTTGTGSITLVVAATGSDTITLVGARDLERTTDFVTAGSLTAAALNTDLDSLVIFAQQLAEENTRALTIPITEGISGSTDMTLPAKSARLGKYLAFNATTGNPEAGPDQTDVVTLAAITSDIATLADIEDGTDATDAIQTVAGISSNVTTVAGISSNVTTVAGNTTNINTVAGISANITTVAGISSDVTAVAGISSAVSAVNSNSTNINTVAGQISPTNNISTVAGLDTEITALGAISSDITTVSGISANVTTVAGISANVTTVAGISANVTTVAGISSDVTGVNAISTAVSNVNANSTNINAVNANSANINTVAGINADITTVAGIAANVTTVANNIGDVNNFAAVYRIGSSDPVTSLDEGDLFYNTTDNEIKYYNGSAWASITAGIANIVEDVTPQLGGNLDLNSNNITGTGDLNFTGSITLTGNVDGRDVSTDGTKLDTIATSATANPNAIDNVVEDTTPQLGGDLDTNSNHIYTANGGIVTRQNAKPIIINGDMAVAQRGTSQTGKTSDHFPVDRFGFQMSNFGTWTSSQSSDVPTGQGFATSLKVDCTTADASLGANDFGVIHYRLEGQDAQLLKKGTASAEYVTISFWVKSNTTGNYVIELFENNNARQISQLYSISSANTWEKKIVTFPGDTTGAITNNNATGLVIHFPLGAGSTFSSGTLNTSWASSVSANRWVGGPNLADSTSNDWYLTGVQMEVGEYDATTIPPFQHESFGDSLLRCQRYYEKTNPATETPSQTDGAVSANWGILNAADSSTLVLSMIQWKVDKRVSPTMTFYATDGTSGNLNVNGTNRAVTASYIGETNLGRISVASGGTAGNYVAFMYEAAAEL